MPAAACATIVAKARTNSHGLIALTSVINLIYFVSGNLAKGTFDFWLKLEIDAPP
jgi:hypothetical protein